MIKAIPEVAADCKLIGYLYHDAPDVMGEDMVDVELPNGILVSAGWYPECDANGSYRIAATRGFDCLMRRETRDFHEAKECIEEFVAALNEAEAAESRKEDSGG